MSEKNESIFERGPFRNTKKKGICRLCAPARRQAGRSDYALQNTLSFFVREGAKRSAEENTLIFFWYNINIWQRKRKQRDKPKRKKRELADCWRALQGIIAVTSIVVAIFTILAAWAKAGIAGDFVYSKLFLLLVSDIILLPLICVVLGFRLSQKK